MNKNRIQLTIAALALAGLSLTGCSIGFSADKVPVPVTAEDGTSADSADSADGADAADAAETDAATDAASEPADTTLGDSAVIGATISQMREALALTATTASCTSGELEVGSPGAVTVEGDCAKIVVTATGALVIAGNVDELIVSGTGSVVSVVSAKKVTVTGTGVTVGWESGTPDITNDGVGSVVGPVK